MNAGGGGFAAALEHKRPLLDFVGKRSSGRAVLAERDRVKAALGSLGAGPGARLLILLPNCPLAVAGLLAGVEMGLQVTLADPRAGEDQFGKRLVAAAPEVILTADLAIVLDRLLRLEAAPGAQVLVAPMAQMLPFPRNLLTPFLRGSGLAQVPDSPGFHDLRTVTEAAIPADDRVAQPKLQLADGEVSFATLLAMARSRGLPDRWILGAPLAGSEALILILASLRQGKRAILTPRLDAATLERLARKYGAAVLPAAPSSDAAETGASAGSG